MNNTSGTSDSCRAIQEKGCPQTDKGENGEAGLFFILRMEADGHMSVPFLSGNLQLVAGLQPEAVKDDIAPFLAVLYGDDQEVLVAELQRSANSLVSVCLNLRIILENAEPAVLRMTATPAVSRISPRTVEWHGYLHRNIAPESARGGGGETSAFFKSLLDDLPVPIYHKNRQGHYLGCNAAFSEFFGYSREQLVGKTVFEIFPRDLAEENHARDEALYAQKECQRFETNVTNSQGVVRHALFNKSVLLDERGEASGLIGVVLDITERKQAEQELKEALEFTEGVLAAIPDLLFEVDRDGQYLNVWTGNQDLLVASRENLLGKTVNDLLPPEAAMDAMRNIAEADRNGYCDGGVIAIPQLDGTVRWFEHTLAKKNSSGGAPTTFFVLARDVTERKQAELAIEEARERLHTVLQTIPDMVWLKDNNGRFLLCNHAFGRLAGMPEADMVGMTARDLFDAETADAIRLKGEEMPNANQILIDEAWVTHAESCGSVLLETRKVPVFTSDGRLTGILGVARDITELNTSREKIKQLAFYDPLTALPNRELFSDHLRQMIASTQQNNKLAGIMLIDLDHFKTINDTLGHPAGDELLRMVAARLSECVGQENTVARLGGDEFAVLLPEIRNKLDLQMVAERVLEAFKAGFLLDGRELFTSCSIGIALCPDDSVVAEDLVRHADSAMYLSKHSGRNTYCFYSMDLENSAKEYLTINTELRRALERQELELLYQPKVSLQNGNIVGSEALLRWRHPEKGLIPPNQFIPVAEETGLIRELGRWVLNEASRAAAAWNTGKGSVHKVAVNLSAREFQEPNLPEAVEEILLRNGCRPEWIEIEITESLLLNDRTNPAETLSALNRMGISIAIDDFGTGYSALSYLTQFPIDTLKIDRSFINKTDRRSLELVKSILSIAKALGQTVVAEGVETIEQAEFLVENGCEIAQGFFFSRPLSADDLKLFMRPSAVDLQEIAV